MGHLKVSSYANLLINKNQEVQAMAWKKIWTYLEIFRTIKSYLEPFGAIWSHLELFGSFWSYLELFGVN